MMAVALPDHVVSVILSKGTFTENTYILGITRQEGNENMAG
jgi:hypothetical protein